MYEACERKMVAVRWLRSQLLGRTPEEFIAAEEQRMGFPYYDAHLVTAENMNRFIRWVDHMEATGVWIDYSDFDPRTPGF